MDTIGFWYYTTLVGYTYFLFRTIYNMAIPVLYGEQLAIARLSMTSVKLSLVVYSIIVVLILLQGILNIRNEK